MKEIIILGLWFACIAALFGFSAFLFYHKVSGAGWFLFAVVLIVVSVKIKV
ncbi:hypothetical protein [Volucribacter amazonae]|uniref:hypothetical protein n=1 Tax=Volucribacter amazonae TaxID=256731 RepID=UPI0024434CC9|nr:hypothetical protein [Volucribacter amazonae]